MTTETQAPGEAGRARVRKMAAGGGDFAPRTLGRYRGAAESDCESALDSLALFGFRFAESGSRTPGAGPVKGTAGSDTSKCAHDQAGQQGFEVGDILRRDRVEGSDVLTGLALQQLDIASETVQAIITSCGSAVAVVAAVSVTNT